MVSERSLSQHDALKDMAQSGHPTAPSPRAAALAFAQMIVCGSDWPEMCQKALEKLLDMFPAADAGAVFVYRSGPDRLVVQNWQGYDGEAVGALSLRSGESMVGKAFQAGQAALYSTANEVALARSEASADNLASLTHLISGSAHPCSAMCIPLSCNDDPLGVLLLENWRGTGAFDVSDLALAQTLAGLLAIAGDRIRMLPEVKRSREVLDEASRLQQDIMAALSHDMRTPLASIKGYASALLLDEVQWDNQTAQEYLEIIVEESDHLSEIIADLLEASRIDAGQIRIEREPTLLPRLAQSVVDEVARRSDKHRFLLSFPDGFPVVDADSSRIRRVLFNLLDNAVKYSPAGGLIVLRGWVTEDEVFVSVADQGQGIPPEHLNRLFERFFRVQFVSGQHVVGSGLGLPIARAILELHGGRIWAESVVGEGTTIFVTLPRSGLSYNPEGIED
jgi:signal transduction histidine kinase